MIMLPEHAVNFSFYALLNIEWDIGSRHWLLILTHMLVSLINEVFVNCLDVTDIDKAFTKFDGVYEIWYPCRQGLRQSILACNM